MSRLLALTLVVAGSLVAVSTQVGCSSSLSQPFQGLKNQPVTIHRLLNYEPPAAQAGTPAAVAQIPAQIQQWVAGVASILPPGLIPPGVLPGTTAPSVDNAQRFYNFRILQTAAVADDSVRADILNLFGNESNFELPHQQCMYAEFGFQIGLPAPGGMVQGAPNPNAPADILVSLSCEQVQMFNYAWPYGAKTGLKPEAGSKFLAIIKRVFS